MRSRLTSGNLALRQAATASCTCCHVWMRPKARRQTSSVDWTPREMRLKPARRSARRAFQSPALSGLASSVISAWGGDAVVLLHGFQQFHAILLPGEGVEVAVGAFGPAEGDVQIQPQRVRLSVHGHASSLGGQDDDGLEGTVHLTGPASDAAVQIHRIKAVRLQKDAVHDAEHGAVAAAGAAHLVDDGPVIAFFPEGMCRIVHDNTRLSVLSV